MNATPSSQRPPSRGLQACLLALAAIFLLLKFMGVIWSDSVDLAHHYALTARIAEFWGLPAGVDPTLGEMNIYPHASHAMAALAGAWFDSPLIGLQLVSLLSIIVVWASLIYLLWSAPKKFAIPALATLMALLVVNRVELRFELHGREVVESYFYAQLVAQALVAFALAMALAMDRGRVEAWLRYVVLAVIAYFCASVHLLPAFQLLGFLGLLVGLESVLRLIDRSAGALKYAVHATGFLLLVTLAMVRHPAYTAMAEISRNNGAFSPKHFGSVEAIAAYAIFVALLSGLVLYAWFKRRTARNADGLLLLKYLGLFGLAVAAVCLAQFLALKMGQGSEYAVKKHIFALNTLVLLELSLAPLVFLAFRHGDAPHDAQDEKGFGYTYLLLPLLTVLAFHGIAPRKPTHATVELVKLEQTLLRNRDSLLALAPGKFVYLRPGPGITPVVAYMMNIGILKTPRGPDRQSNTLRLLRSEPISDWPLVGTILVPTRTQEPAQAAEACQRPATGLPFTVMDGQCVGQSIGMPASIIRLTSGRESPCRFTGFGAPEEYFTWTTQEQASIECPIPLVGGRPATSVTISAGAFLDHVPFQRARVSVNKGPATEVRFDSASSQQSIVLQLPADSGPTCRIDFTLPDSISPSEVGVSVDPRRLGLRISEVEFK